MIITCHNCQTKYQVTYEAIGSVGRKVQCASCHQSWQQSAMPDPKPDLRLVPPDPESDRLFESMAEEALDAAIELEREAVADLAERIERARVERQRLEIEKAQRAVDASDAHHESIGRGTRHEIFHRAPVALCRHDEGAVLMKTSGIA